MVEAATVYYQDLTEKIKHWSKQLGFSAVGITDVDLTKHKSALQTWLDNKYHGDMDYMATHGLLRAKPSELLPGAIRCISVRMNYLPANAQFAKVLKNKQHAYVSRYALGRDYHKLMRNKLKKLGDLIRESIESTDFASIKAELSYRPFVDSAPILERPLAEKAGLGWVGKHSLLIHPEAGSWFFLGELLINLPLPITPLNEIQQNQCGHCVACMKICPTNAIVAPYVVDAKKCISYLTIELRDEIPEAYRPLIGNRIYGCDDCQLVCPWNKFGQLTDEKDFHPRNQLDDASLLSLFAWSEQEFLQKLQGSPIRRIGYDCWQRNLAVALGNADHHEDIIKALENKLSSSSEMVAKHIVWAIKQQKEKRSQQVSNQRLTERLIRTVEKGLPRDA